LCGAREGLDYAGAVAERYAAEAVGALDVFPPSEAKTALLGLVDFVMKRQH